MEVWKLNFQSLWIYRYMSPLEDEYSGGVQSGYKQDVKIYYYVSQDNPQNKLTITTCSRSHLYMMAGVRWHN